MLKDEDWGHTASVIQLNWKLVFISILLLLPIAPVVYVYVYCV